MNLYHRSLAGLVAIASLMGRHARLELLAPKTIKIPRGRGKINQTQECARRLRQKERFGEQHGALTWKGCWALTFGPG